MEVFLTAVSFAEFQNFDCKANNPRMSCVRARMVKNKGAYQQVKRVFDNACTAFDRHRENIGREWKRHFFQVDHV